MFKLNSSRKKDVIALGICLLVTFAMTFPLWKSQQLLIANDWSFHASRVEEICENLKSGHFFTYIATHTFQKTGVANFIFYPTIFLYPWAFLRLILSPVAAFYSWYALVNLGTLVITYYCAKEVMGSWVKALLVALIYVLMPYHIFVGTGVFGEFLAMTFIPLVLLGGYNLFFTGEHPWKLLAVGLTLVGYCHFLSVILCCEVLAILFILSLLMKKWGDKKRWLALLKAVGLTTILMAGIIVAFLTNYMGQKIISTNDVFNYAMIQPLKNFIFDSFGVGYGQNLGIILIVAAFTGFATSSIKFFKIVWFLGVVISFMVTSDFPWQLLNNYIRELGVIQFTYRYLTYAGILLSLVAADVIGQLVENQEERSRSKGLVLLAVTFVAVLYPLSIWHNGDWTSNPAYSKIERNDFKGTVKGTEAIYRVDNQTYSQIFSHGVLYGEGDYYPSVARAGNNEAFFGDVVKNSLTRSIVDGVTYVDGKKVIAKQVSGANKITYLLTDAKDKTVDLPFLVYKNTYLNVSGKNVAFQVSKRGTVQFKANSNKVEVTVGYLPSISMIVSLLVTIIGWVALIVWWIFSMIHGQSMS
ncbi:hypothetical protein HCZ13_09655 [Limosilactobacillus fermentum]